MGSDGERGNHKVKWLFWQQDSPIKSELAVQQLTDQVSQLTDRIGELRDSMADNEMKLTELDGQLTKLTRLQFKSGQETQSKLEQLRQELAGERRWQAEYERLADHNDGLLGQRRHILEIIIQQLDEFDAVLAGLQAEAAGAWRPLLAQWIERSLTALATSGIQEITAAGKSFDPQTADGVGAIPRPSGSDSAVPYEVAAVVRRGFMNQAGEVIRKTQVIVYMETE